MNERLKEIAELAIMPTKDEYFNEVMVFSKKRFAELIVKDCIDIVNNTRFNAVRTTYDADLAQAFKETVEGNLKAMFNE